MRIPSPRRPGLSGVRRALLGVVAYEDRDNTNVTGWAWYYGQSEAQISSLVTSPEPPDRRPEVENPGTTPHKFTVAFVSNAGTYNKGWNWLYDATVSYAATFAVNNNNSRSSCRVRARAGTCAWRGVHRQHGADYKAWWALRGRHARDPFEARHGQQRAPHAGQQLLALGNTRYAGIMVSNTAADQRTWWWYVGQSSAQVVATRTRTAHASPT